MKGKKITAKMISLMSKQSLKSSKMRNIFVMITIVLASALLTTVLMFAAGQKQKEKNDLSHRRQVSYYNLTKEQTEQLKKDERIETQIQLKTGILSEMDGFDVMPFYVSEFSDQIRIGELESGSFPESEHDIAVQAAMLVKMQVEPAAGSSVTFTFYDGSKETFKVSGILKGSETTKQFPVFFSEDYAKNGSQLKERPYEVYARLSGAEGMYPQECKELMYLIGSSAGIEREYVNPSKSFLDSLSVNMQSVMIYGLVGIVILLACVLVIYGVFYLSVIGRIHQFGQLRTLGMTRQQMKKFVAREGGFLFLCSAPIGVALGGVAGYLIIPDGFKLSHTLIVISVVFVTVFIITMISVRKPARLAASVSPMEALRYVPQDGMKKTANKKLCRRLTPYDLGIMNFSKNRKKTVVTMLSLALGGILFMTAAAYISSFDKEKYARQGYFTDAEFNIQYSAGAIERNEYGESGLQAQEILGESMIQEICAVDGVKKITEIKGFGVKYDYPKQDEYDSNDNVTPLTVEETKELAAYLEDGSSDYDKLMSGDYILIMDNNTAEEIFGWKFLTGDQITLHYYDGTKMAEKKVTILGILNDQFLIDHSGLIEGWFAMPEQAILNLVSYKNINSHLIVSTDEEKESEIEESLLKLIADKPELQIETLSERKIEYAQNANQQFGIISGLSIFIMMFSILSMMNTLITNIVTRKQELAMLESIGMSKAQLRRMLLTESLFLVFVTVGITMTIGTVCGYLLSRCLYKIGAFYMAFQFPGVFSAAYITVLILVPLVITFVSMRSFSREPLVERLRGTEN